VKKVRSLVIVSVSPIITKGLGIQENVANLLREATGEIEGHSILKEVNFT